MFALVEGQGYPNTAIITFYVLASAIFALAIHRYHRTQP
jgi:hypothetical protein